MPQPQTYQAATEQMAKEKFTGVKGMNDMLPQDAPIWQYVQKTCVDVLSSYGYQEIRTPILENTRVFTRGVGEVTDIVERRCTASPTL